MYMTGDYFLIFCLVGMPILVNTRSLNRDIARSQTNASTTKKLKNDINKANLAYAKATGRTITVQISELNPILNF